MVNVSHKKCEKCDRQPTFHTFNVKKARFCGEHKDSGMVDVTCTSCEKCDRRPVYGFAGKKASFCYEHRITNTISKPNKKCLEPNCKDFAVFGIIVHEHCEKHKLNDVTNITERKCKGIINKNENCETCDPGANKRIRLAKHNMVKDYLFFHEN